MTINRDELKLYLSYDKNTGKFIRIRKTKGARIGDVAGHLDKGKGYVEISVGGRKYYAHHLVWLYHFGYIPKEIDHINGSCHDNRLENLRETTHKENLRNQKRRNTNTSGITGVCYNKARSCWMAYIKVNYKNKYLGLFKNKEDAALARKSAEIEYGFHPNHGRF